MAVGSSTAAADPTVGPPICSSAGMPLSGTVGNLTITGNTYVPAGSTLTVRGNLTLAPGSCFDAFTVATVNVTGSVNVGRGAILGLGCSPGAIGPEPPCGMTTTDDVVGNGISAREPLTMYLTAVTVFGNVTSIGGGPGPTLNPYINFPIKENTITPQPGHPGLAWGLVRGAAEHDPRQRRDPDNNVGRHDRRPRNAGLDRDRDEHDLGIPGVLRQLAGRHSSVTPKEPRTWSTARRRGSAPQCELGASAGGSPRLRRGPREAGITAPRGPFRVWRRPSGVVSSPSSNIGEADSEWDTYVKPYPSPR